MKFQTHCPKCDLDVWGEVDMAVITTKVDGHKVRHDKVRVTCPQCQEEIDDDKVKCLNKELLRSRCGK